MTKEISIVDPNKIDIVRGALEIDYVRNRVECELDRQASAVRIAQEMGYRIDWGRQLSGLWTAWGVSEKELLQCGVQLNDDGQMPSGIRAIAIEFQSFIVVSGMTMEDVLLGICCLSIDPTSDIQMDSYELDRRFLPGWRSYLVNGRELPEGSNRDRTTNPMSQQADSAEMLNEIVHLMHDIESVAESSTQLLEREYRDLKLLLQPAITKMQSLEKAIGFVKENYETFEKRISKICSTTTTSEPASSMQIMYRFAEFKESLKPKLERMSQLQHRSSLFEEIRSEVNM